MLNKEDVKMAYIAGILDGDGSFSLLKEKRANGFKYSPCIQLSNVFEGMIDLLYQTFGGSKKIKSPQGHAKKIQYVWNVRGFQSCKNVIEKVIPYIVLKKKQANLLLNFVNQSDNLNHESEKIKLQLLNNDCLVADGRVVKQALKDSDDAKFWAYFSGILDTEGSFSIRRNKPSWGCVNHKYNPIINISMASFDTMNFIRKNICLGKICFPKAKTTQRGFTYRLYFARIKDCISIIQKCLPYLRFKKDVALEMLNFCENYTPLAHKQTGISAQELDFRHQCYERIKQLNEYGVYKPSLIDSEARQGDEGQV